MHTQVIAKRRQWAGVLMLGMASLVWADKVAEVSADFLEYLGSLEDADDNWTDFTADALAARSNANKADGKADSKVTVASTASNSKSANASSSSSQAAQSSAAVVGNQRSSAMGKVDK